MSEASLLSRQKTGSTTLHCTREKGVCEMSPVTVLALCPETISWRQRSVLESRQCAAPQWTEAAEIRVGCSWFLQGKRPDSWSLQGKAPERMQQDTEWVGGQKSVWGFFLTSVAEVGLHAQRKRLQEIYQRAVATRARRNKGTLHWLVQGNTGGLAQWRGCINAPTVTLQH